MSPPRLDRERLEIGKLDTSQPVPAFSCGDDDLDGFLRDDAARLQDAGVTQVYLAWYESELVGYAALLADSIELKTNDVKRLRPLTHVDARLVIPAVKLGRLAVSSAFKARFSGCGTYLVQLAVDVAKDTSLSIGCRTAQGRRFVLPCSTAFVGATTPRTSKSPTRTSGASGVLPIANNRHVNSGDSDTTRHDQRAKPNRAHRRLVYTRTSRRAQRGAVT